MFDWMLPEKHAIAILKKDHDVVKELFEKFEKADSTAQKERIISKAVHELKIHAAIEEEIFYPAVRKHVERDLMNEADEEHHVARVLIAELDSGRDFNGHRDAKFTVLAENVRHHIKEEENELLPKAKALDIDFMALGQLILHRRAALEKGGIPDDAEHAMVAKARRKVDSPAAKARKTTSRLRKTPGKALSRRTAEAGRARASR
jgi:hypothetical protein